MLLPPQGSLTWGTSLTHNPLNYTHCLKEGCVDLELFVRIIKTKCIWKRRRGNGTLESVWAQLCQEL